MEADTSLPFARDSPTPRRAGAPIQPPTPRNKKRASKTTLVHVRHDSADSIDEPFWPQEPVKPVMPAKSIPQRPSLADLTNSVGILASKRGRLAHVKSTPALRISRSRSGGSPTKGAIAPARIAAEQLNLAQVISSSVPLSHLPASGHQRMTSADSMASMESLVDLIIGEKSEEAFTPSSPEVIRIVERQWTELFARDQRDREKRRTKPELAAVTVLPSPPEPAALDIFEVEDDVLPPVKALKHTFSTPALRTKASISTLADRKQPKLLRTAASMAALRPVVSPATGEIAANGSARILNDPAPLRRRQQTSAEPSIPPRSPALSDFPPSPTASGSKRKENEIVSFPNAEEVAEKLNAAMRSRRRQRKWYHDWLAFGPTAAPKASEATASVSGAKTALRGLLGEQRPPLSRAPSFELAPRITISSEGY